MINVCFQRPAKHLLGWIRPRKAPRARGFYCNLIIAINYSGGVLKAGFLRM